MKRRKRRETKTLKETTASPVAARLVEPATANTPDPTRPMTEDEAARYLRQKPRTLRLWRSTRALPHLKLTQKVVLYRRSDLDRWLERHMQAIAA